MLRKCEVNRIYEKATPERIAELVALAGQKGIRRDPLLSVDAKLLIFTVWKLSVKYKLGGRTGTLLKESGSDESQRFFRSLSGQQLFLFASNALKHARESLIQNPDQSINDAMRSGVEKLQLNLAPMVARWAEKQSAITSSF